MHAAVGHLTGHSSVDTSNDVHLTWPSIHHIQHSLYLSGTADVLIVSALYHSWTLLHLSCLTIQCFLDVSTFTPRKVCITGKPKQHALQ